MGRTVALTLGLRGAGAVAWLVYSWVLTQVLDPVALGEVLYALVFGGLLAALTSAGWAQLLLRDGARFMQDGLSGCMAGLVGAAAWGGLGRIAIVGAGMACAYSTGLLPKPISGLLVAILTTGIAGAMALIMIHASAHRACGHLARALVGPGVLRAGLPLILTLTIFFFQPISSVSALLIHLISLCLILIWLLAGLPRDRGKKQQQQQNRRALRDLGLGQIGHVLLTHMDVLVLGWVVGPIDAGIYLIVRRIAGVLSLVFDALRSAFAPTLSVAFHQNGAADVAVNVNRMFLLVGGAIGAGLILSAQLVLPIFGVGQATVMYYWLVLGGITPALFGATGLLMMMGDMEKLRLALIASFLPVSFIVLVWTGTIGTTELAIAVAMLQLALGACGAILLRARHGIRPGVFLLGQK